MELSSQAGKREKVEEEEFAMRVSTGQWRFIQERQDKASPSHTSYCNLLSYKEYSFYYLVLQDDEKQWTHLAPSPARHPTVSLPVDQQCSSPDDRTLHSERWFAERSRL